LPFFRFPALHFSTGDSFKNAQYLVELKLSSNKTQMEQRKTAIVTGANFGLGFETAKRIAGQEEWSVVLACRSVERGEQAAKKIIKESKNNNVSAVAQQK
jgi:hypothetical protein